MTFFFTSLLLDSNLFGLLILLFTFMGAIILLSFYLCHDELKPLSACLRLLFFPPWNYVSYLLIFKGYLFSSFVLKNAICKNLGGKFAFLPFHLTVAFNTPYFEPYFILGDLAYHSQMISNPASGTRCCWVRFPGTAFQPPQVHTQLWRYRLQLWEWFSQSPANCSQWMAHHSETALMCKFPLIPLRSTFSYII